MTDLENYILSDNSKKHWKNVANWVLDNDALEDLMKYFLNQENSVLTQRTSGVFMTLVDIDKNIFYDYQKDLVEKLSDKEIHEAQQRNIFRLFQFIYIREEIEGELLDACFKALENPTLPITVRVFAMTTAARIAKRFPEIGPELRSLIELNLEMNPSSGLKNRARKILEKL